MRTVFWSDKERWFNHHHYELLIEDITGFNLQENLCAETVKYIAKRLSDTPYRKMFRVKYSIFQGEYKTLVDKFNTKASNNSWLEVHDEKIQAFC